MTAIAPRNPFLSLDCMPRSALNLILAGMMSMHITSCITATPRTTSDSIRLVSSGTSSSTASTTGVMRLEKTVATQLPIRSRFRPCSTQIKGKLTKHTSMSMATATYRNTK